MIDQKLAQAAQQRMLDRLFTFPAVESDGPFRLRKVGKKNIGMLSGATDTHMIAILRTDLAPDMVGENFEGRARIQAEHPDDMWEFSSESIEEVEQQFTELIDRLETT